MFQFFEVEELEQQEDEIKKAKKQYEENKKKKTKEIIKCPWCKKEIVKKNQYHQFCSNKGKSNCKDSYWNHISEERILRVINFKKGNENVNN